MNATLYRNYEDFCATTAIYPREVEIEYLALGLASEAGEVLDAVIRPSTHVEFKTHLLSEAGDCAWYIARLYNSIGQSFSASAAVLSDLPFTPSNSIITSAMELAAEAGLIAGLVKKQIRDGKNWTGEEREEHRNKMAARLTGCLHALVLYANVLSQKFNDPAITFDAMLNYNIEKLTSRKTRGVLGGSGDNR